MSLKNYLTTFELASECERKLLKNISSELSNLYDSARQLYHRTPMIMKAGALVGLGILGTLTYQKVAEPDPAEEEIWISYYHGGTGDAKDRPYDYHGFVTADEFESIQKNKYIKINDVEFRRK